GLYYQNIFSYYHASGSVILEASRARDLQVFGQQLGLTVNARFNAKADLDAYVDQNIIGMTTPFKILGANYGFILDIPFDAVHGTDDASLDVRADLKGLFDRNFSTGASFSRNRSATADFNIAISTSSPSIWAGTCVSWMSSARLDSSRPRGATALTEPSTTGSAGGPRCSGWAALDIWTGNEVGRSRP